MATVPHNLGRGISVHVGKIHPEEAGLCAAAIGTPETEDGVMAASDVPLCRLSILLFGRLQNRRSGGYCGIVDCRHVDEVAVKNEDVVVVGPVYLPVRVGRDNRRMFVGLANGR